MVRARRARRLPNLSGTHQPTESCAARLTISASVLVKGLSFPAIGCRGAADHIDLGSPADFPYGRVIEGWHSQPGSFGPAAEEFSLRIGRDSAGNPIYSTDDGDVAWSARYSTPLSLFAPSGEIFQVRPGVGLMTGVDFIPPNQQRITMLDGSILEPAPVRGIIATKIPAGRWRD